MRQRTGVKYELSQVEVTTQQIQRYRVNRHTSDKQHYSGTQGEDHHLLYQSYFASLSIVNKYY
jgi:hypothetical protein